MAWFALEELHRAADDASVRRGERYVSAVEGAEDLPDCVVATVHGAEPSTVRLTRSREALTGWCSCPVGVDGTLCHRRRP